MTGHAAVDVIVILYNFRNTWEESRTVKALMTSLPLPAVCLLAVNEAHIKTMMRFLFVSLNESDRTPVLL